MSGGQRVARLQPGRKWLAEVAETGGELDLEADIFESQRQTHRSFAEAFSRAQSSPQG
jgi:hypothetical protein